jgi:N-methylhydantoinase A
MAQGVREVTIKRGVDPREFPMVVAGGAGPIHACMIGEELDLPLLIVPRESSIFCAAGMLMSDLRHDFVRSCVARLDGAEWPRIERLVDEMIAEGHAHLARERIAEAERRFVLHLDCRYARQYHEVSFAVPMEALRRAEVGRIRNAFYAEHNRLYGYSLEDQGTPIELINLRVQAVGVTAKPSYRKLDARARTPVRRRKASGGSFCPRPAAPSRWRSTTATGFASAIASQAPRSSSRSTPRFW